MLIYLAGCEGQHTFTAIKDGYVDSAFLSYYYLRNKKDIDNYKILSFCRKHIKHIIIDSGAHTFFSEQTGDGLSVSVHKKVTKTKETHTEYFRKYIKRVNKFKKYFDNFVELDIGEIVGQKKVEEWREELKKNNCYNQCITVYHPNCVTRDEYINMLDTSESGYVALEGDRPGRDRIKYMPLLQEAIKRGIKVHGFAQTKIDIMENYPFYSVDSSSRLTGVQYGQSKIIVDGDVKNMVFKSKNILKVNSKLLPYCYSKKLPVQHTSRLKIAAESYYKLQLHYTNLRKKRGIDYNLILNNRKGKK